MLRWVPSPPGLRAAFQGMPIDPDSENPSGTKEEAFFDEISVAHE